MPKGLVCFDMDGVLVDYLSTWEWIYNKLNLSNEESYNAFQLGLITEWDWIKYDLNLIGSALKNKMNNNTLHDLLVDCPLMMNLETAIQSLIDYGLEVSIISGGMHPVAHRIASFFPSNDVWKMRFGGIDALSSKSYCSGSDTKLHVFTNGWNYDSKGEILANGRYQVQLIAKGSIVKILQRRLSIGMKKTVAIGDSKQDTSMFEHSGYKIAFNTKSEELIKSSDISIEKKDLKLVSDKIIEYFNSLENSN
jgi:phosphoserine phosphatase